MSSIIPHPCVVPISNYLMLRHFLKLSGDVRTRISIAPVTFLIIPEWKGMNNTSSNPSFWASQKKSQTLLTSGFGNVKISTDNIQSITQGHTRTIQ